MHVTHQNFFPNIPGCEGLSRDRSFCRSRDKARLPRGIPRKKRGEGRSPQLPPWDRRYLNWPVIPLPALGSQVCRPTSIRAWTDPRLQLSFIPLRTINRRRWTETALSPPPPSSWSWRCPPFTQKSCTGRRVRHRQVSILSPRSRDRWLTLLAKNRTWKTERREWPRVSCTRDIIWSLVRDAIVIEENRKGIASNCRERLNGGMSCRGSVIAAERLNNRGLKRRFHVLKREKINWW